MNKQKDWTECRLLNGYDTNLPNNIVFVGKTDMYFFLAFAIINV